MPKTVRIVRVFLALAALTILAQAHVGSPDIYLNGKAGPYQLFVTIRPPQVIPGVAELEIRSETPGVRQIRAVPMPMSGPGAQFAPVPDKLSVSRQDPQFFTGRLWMMSPGSWQVRLSADGLRGKGELAIPVPSAARATKKMQFGLGAVLAVLGLFLIGGVVAIAGAAEREAKLDPGAKPGPQNIKTARVAMAIGFVIVVAAVWGGNAWWSNEACSYGEQVYKPMEMQATLDDSGVLTLNLSDPGWLKPRPNHLSFFTRSVDDLIPDHNHLMHLYAIRQPGLDVVYHLHPQLAGSGIFRLDLPAMPPGDYNLYADVVHANGFPETLVSSVRVPVLAGRPLSGDDAAGTAVSWKQASTDASAFELPDHYKMVWLRPPALHAKRPVLFRFRLETPGGAAPKDMQLYMGMLGHAAFVKTDGSVFAHIHPTGTVSMAALMLAQKPESNPPPTMSNAGMPDMDMPGMSGAGHGETPENLPNEVSFPYGFPSPGHYRIFVQMKHAETVETAAFDAIVL